MCPNPYRHGIKESKTQARRLEPPRRVRQLWHTSDKTSESNKFVLMYRCISWARTQCTPILQQQDFLADLQSLRWIVPMDLVKFEVCNSKLLPSLACTFVPASYPSAVCQFPVVPSILETVQNMLSFFKVTRDHEKVTGTKCADTWMFGGHVPRHFPGPGQTCQVPNDS